MNRRSPASRTKPTAAGPPCARRGSKPGPPGLDTSMAITMRLAHHFFPVSRRQVKGCETLIVSSISVRVADERTVRAIGGGTDARCLRESGTCGRLTAQRREVNGPSAGCGTTMVGDVRYFPPWYEG